MNAYLWMQHDLRTDEVYYWLSSGAHPNHRINTTVLALVHKGTGDDWKAACRDAVWMAGLPMQVLTQLAAELDGRNKVIFDAEFLRRHTAYHERGEFIPPHLERETA